jgi:hypothetical protein
MDPGRSSSLGQQKGHNRSFLRIVRGSTDGFCGRADGAESMIAGLNYLREYLDEIAHNELIAAAALRPVSDKQRYSCMK